MGDRLGVYRAFSGEPWEIDKLEDPGVNRWKDNNMMILQEVGTWTRSGSVAFCRACNTHRVTQKNGNF